MIRGCIILHYSACWPSSILSWFKLDPILWDVWNILNFIHKLRILLIFYTLSLLLYLRNFIHRLRILLLSYRMGSNLYQEKIDVCNQELIVVETYTSFNHNYTWIINVSTNFIYIYVCVCVYMYIYIHT